MALSKSVLVLLTLVLFFHNFFDANSLSDNYYSSSCPNAESVIQQAVNSEIDKDSRLPARLIRMQFHDCFVEGCDASILLDGENTEKTAPVNEHLAGYEAIDVAKAAVEAICPGVVSCADIIAYAARDSVVKVNGTGWAVQAGRKDGYVSNATTAQAELPPPTFGVDQLVNSFARKGLSKRQMVVLSGSHTVGVSHCENVIPRLYNFSATNPTDPSLNATYAEELKQLCPQFNFDPETVITMDPITPGEFDSNYYVTLTQRKGLFTSDQTLHDNRRTRSIVLSLLNESIFDCEFGKAMRAMAAVEVKTEGQIRTNCRVVNSA